MRAISVSFRRSRPARHRSGSVPPAEDGAGQVGQLGAVAAGQGGVVAEHRPASSGLRRTGSSSEAAGPEQQAQPACRLRGVPERRTRRRGDERPRPGCAGRADPDRDRVTPTATSSSSGRICCMSREERVRPRVSSARAARVRSASVKPKAARRSHRGAGRERRVRHGGRRPRAADGRTAARGSTGPRPGASLSSPLEAGQGRGRGVVAVAEHPGQAGHAAAGSAGTAWTWASSTSCRRCSTVGGTGRRRPGRGRRQRPCNRRPELGQGGQRRAATAAPGRARRGRAGAAGRRTRRPGSRPALA